MIRPGVSEALVGDWRIEGGEMSGARLSIHRDGRFEAWVPVDGRNVKIEATVAQRGSSLQFNFVNPQTGASEVKTQNIKSIAERELIVEENSVSCRLVRIGQR